MNDIKSMNYWNELPPGHRLFMLHGVFSSIISKLLFASRRFRLARYTVFRQGARRGFHWSSETPFRL